MPSPDHQGAVVVSFNIKRIRVNGLNHDFHRALSDEVAERYKDAAFTLKLGQRTLYELREKPCREMWEQGRDLVTRMRGENLLWLGRRPAMARKSSD